MSLKVEKKNFFDFATTPVLFIFKKIEKKFEKKFEKNPQLTFTHSFLNSLIFTAFSPKILSKSIFQQQNFLFQPGPSALEKLLQQTPKPPQ